MQKHIPTFLFILSIALLIPGILQPFMTISADLGKQELFDTAVKELLPSAQQANNFMQSMLQAAIKDIHFEGSVRAFESTRSLWETLTELIAHDHVLVGLMITFFGIIIPLIKILLTLTALFLATGENRSQLLNISSLLSKWSMSDVFFMAILVAFFSINANEQSIDAVQMHAVLGPGFYYFASYCLVAIAASQLMQLQDKPR